MTSSNIFKVAYNAYCEVDPLVAILALVLGLYFVTYKNIIWTKRKNARRQAMLVDQFPGFGYYPFLGSIPEIYQLARYPCRDMLPWHISMAKKFGPIYKFWLPGQPKLVILCTDTAIKLLQHPSFQDKPSEVGIIAKVCKGEGLLSLKPDVHGPRKKMWLQWMTKKHINDSLGQFRQQSVRFCKVLEEFSTSGQEFDVMDHAIHCTLSTVSYSAFGEEYMDKLPVSVGKQHIHDLHTFSFNSMKRLFRPWLANDWFYLYLTSEGRETLKCVTRGNELTHRAVDERKLLRQNNADQNKGKLPCFLDHLLDLEERGLLTTKEIIHELNVFIIAGYDTTGLAICYTLYLLSLNPEHQTQIVDELVDIFGENLDDMEEITPGHIRQMRHLELCIKETLRFYPILPWAFRRTTAEIVLPDGKIIPEGVDTYVSLIQIHQDTRYFPEPEKFIPSRHLVPIPAFMPFSLGSRSCVGQVYAIQEMKVILAHLLMKYRWETREKRNIQPFMSPVLVPENGISFKIEKRFK